VPAVAELASTHVQRAPSLTLTRQRQCGCVMPCRCAAALSLCVFLGAPLPHRRSAAVPVPVPARGPMPLAAISVVLPEAPNCIERAAAAELRREIAMLTAGTTTTLPPLLFEPQPGASSSPRIFVGNTSASAWQLATGAGHRVLRPEEAVVFVGGGGDLFVRGDDFGSPAAPNSTSPACRSTLAPDLPACVGVMVAPTPAGCHAGTYFAVAVLLREVLGLRWVWPGDDGVVRPKPDLARAISSDSFPIRTAPTLSLRRLRPDPASGIPRELTAALGPLWHNVSDTIGRSAAEDAVWMLRNGLGGRTTVPWGQAFMHSWEQDGATHPEWFAEHADGSRGCQKLSDCADHPQYVKVDASSSGMAAHVAAGLQPGALGVSACEDDLDSGYCTCDKCRALDPVERAASASGRLSDRYTYFWNAVHRQLRENGHPDSWVGAYAYASYSDPPLRQRFDNHSNVLVLSVAFGSVLDYDSSTAKSRSGWGGWVGAGAKGMALRPNSLWSEYAGLPFVFSDQWLDNVEWCGRNAMLAADFDSLLGDWAAVGPSYYALARTLWNPGNSNRSAILHEYYSAFGAAGATMRKYFEFWRAFAQRVYSDPAVVGRIKGYDHHLGPQRAQYIMAGLYTETVIVQASSLLAQAESLCGSAGDPSCTRVAKSRAHLAYTHAMAATANATAPSAGPFRRTVSHLTEPAGLMVVAARALRTAGQAISGQHVVNTFYQLGKANERTDLLGLLAADDAPDAPVVPAYMLSPLYWFMALDPTDAGVERRWFRPSFPHETAWNRSAVGCRSGFNWCGRCGSTAMDEWARTHGGRPFQGVSWWAVHDTCAGSRSSDCIPLLGGRNTTKLYLKDGSGATSVTVWLDGVMLGGCASSVECAREMSLSLPGAGRRLAPGKSALVVRVNTTTTGSLRRMFVLD
jgi:hypothetical protein